MAKVQMPLLGISAKGQIGKALVYFNWKGLNVARKYLIPANPKTSAQLAQRGNFTNAVNAFHDANFTENDRTAWNTLAATTNTPQSGFNIFVKLYINAILNNKTFTTIKNVTVSSITSNSATVTGTITSDKTSILYWGTTKTFIANSVNGSFDSGTVTFNLSDLPSNSIIYFYIKNTSTNETGRTGIYSFRTA